MMIAMSRKFATHIPIKADSLSLGSCRNPWYHSLPLRHPPLLYRPVCRRTPLLRPETCNAKGYSCRNVYGAKRASRQSMSRLLALAAGMKARRTVVTAGLRCSDDRMRSQGILPTWRPRRPTSGHLSLEVLLSLLRDCISVQLGRERQRPVGARIRHRASTRVPHRRSFPAVVQRMLLEYCTVRENHNRWLFRIGSADFRDFSAAFPGAGFEHLCQTKPVVAGQLE